MSEGPPLPGLKAIAHPLRFRLLQAIGEGERNVGEIQAASGIDQPALSQQLAVLRKAGLVTTRKEARLVFYSLDHDRVAALARAVAALSGERKPPRRTPARASRGGAHFARMS